LSSFNLFKSQQEILVTLLPKMAWYSLLMLFSFSVVALSGKPSRLASRGYAMITRSPGDLSEQLDAISKTFILEYLEANLPSMVASSEDAFQTTAIQVMKAVVSLMEEGDGTMRAGEQRAGEQRAGPRLHRRFRPSLRSKLINEVSALWGNEDELFRPIEVLIPAIEAIIKDKDVAWARNEIEIMEFLGAKSGKDAMINAFDNAVLENQLVFELK